MRYFIENYAGTVLVAAILLAVVFFALRKMIKDKKNGKGTCGCGCEDCAYSKSCHSKNKSDEK